MDDTRETLRRVVGDYAPKREGYERVVRRLERKRRRQRIFAAAMAAAIVLLGSVLFAQQLRGDNAPLDRNSPIPVLPTIDARVFGSGDHEGFRVQTPRGWYSPDGRTVLKRGPEVLAVSVWDVEKVPRDACHWRGTLGEPGPTVDDLVGALVAQKPRIATEPTEGTLGGYPGRYLEWLVPADMVVTGDADFHGCDSQENGHLDFVGWFSNLDAEQYAQVAGQVDRLWVLDVDGQRLLVDAAYSPDTTHADRSELDQVAESIRFTLAAPIGPNDSGPGIDLPASANTTRVGTLRAFGTTWNVKVSRAPTGYYAVSCVGPATTGSGPRRCERHRPDRVSVQTFDRPSPAAFISQVVGENVRAIDVVADDGRVFHAVMVPVRGGGFVAVVALEGGGSGRLVYHLTDGSIDQGRGQEAHVEWTDQGQVIGAGSFPPPGRA